MKGRERFRLFLALVLAMVSLGAGSWRARAWEPLSSPDPDVREGNRLLREGDAEGALRAYERAEARLGDDPALALDRGLALMAAGKQREAERALRRAARPDAPKSVRAEALYDLGLLAQRLGAKAASQGDREEASRRFQQAREAYRAALRLRPGHRGAAWNLEVLERARRRLVQPPPQPRSSPRTSRDGGVPPPDAAGADASHAGAQGSSSSLDGGRSDGGATHSSGARQDGGQGEAGTASAARMGSRGPGLDGGVADGGSASLDSGTSGAGRDGGLSRDGGLQSDAGGNESRGASAASGSLGRDGGAMGDASSASGSLGRDGGLGSDGGARGAARRTSDQEAAHGSGRGELPEDLRRLLDALERAEHGFGRWRRDPRRRRPPAKPW